MKAWKWVHFKQIFVFGWPIKKLNLPFVMMIYFYIAIIYIYCSLPPSRTHMRRDPGNLLTRSSVTPRTFCITSTAEPTKPKQADTKTVFPLEQWSSSITQLHHLNRWITRCASVVYSIYCIHRFFLSFVYSFFLNLLLLHCKKKKKSSGFINVIIINSYITLKSLNKCLKIQVNFFYN